MAECNKSQKTQFSIASSALLLLALLAALFFVKQPPEELRPMLIGAIGGAVLAQTSILLCRNFWSSATWAGAMAAMIVMITLWVGYENETTVVTSFIVTGLLIFAGFGVHCHLRKNRADSA